MLDTLPLKQYQENYQAILDNNPLPYGSLRGKVLNSDQFWRDHGDYEPVLRQHVPEKYHKYFSSPRKTPRALDDSIEIGRSYSLSPVKKREPSYGHKESEKLVDDLFEADRKQYVSRADDDDPSRSLFQQTYKALSYDRSAQGEKLNSLVRKISTEFQEVRDENGVLRRENNNLRSKLKQAKEENQSITSATEFVKSKFDKYYAETLKLREELARLKTSPQEAAQPPQTQQTTSHQTLDEQLAMNEERMKQLALSTQQQLEALETEKASLLNQKESIHINPEMVTVITVGDGVIKVEQKQANGEKPSQVRIQHANAPPTAKEPQEPKEPAKASCPVCSHEKKVNFESDDGSDDSVPLDDTMIYKKTHKPGLFSAAANKHSEINPDLSW
ncbi:hypothetical protein OGAPHI_000853 [Ogataea philodendri]|uniref:Uncharacterized protein n=1 Tax=Ogataea philodendri TaxID=1378263 RepID=A0A9P8PH27_9ASCO|nr:uncharacterized protein OGAPHI_000853 [Ogataea philodendri]KAH3671142.1 hypothetical protein OGAPHI_000853 [Ogataea philodendri]